MIWCEISPKPPKTTRRVVFVYSYIHQQDYYRTNLDFCLRKILTYRLEYAIIHKVENGHFDIECVAQYPQNTLKIPSKYPQNTLKIPSKYP